MALGFLFLIPWHKIVINNIFGEVNLALKHMAKAPNPMVCFGPQACAHRWNGCM